MSVGTNGAAAAKRAGAFTTVLVCRRCGAVDGAVDLPMWSVAFGCCRECGNAEFRCRAGRWHSTAIWWKPWTWLDGYWEVLDGPSAPDYSSLRPPRDAPAGRCPRCGEPL